MWKLNNALLNNQKVKEEIKQELQKHPHTNENKTHHIKTQWVQKSSSEGKVYSN